MWYTNRKLNKIDKWFLVGEEENGPEEECIRCECIVQISDFHHHTKIS